MSCSVIENYIQIPDYQTKINLIIKLYGRLKIKANFLLSLRNTVLEGKKTTVGILLPCYKVYLLK